VLRKLEDMKHSQKTKMIKSLILSHDGQALREIRDMEQERNFDKTWLPRLANK